MLDMYQEITDRIIAELEKGYIPWIKGWSGGNQYAVSHVTGKPYSLLNQVLLQCVEDAQGPGEYITYRQAVEEGGHVKKGEKASMVVFWKFLDKKDPDTGEVIIGDDGQPEKIGFLKKYSVFHISQCEGIEPKWIKPVEPNNDLKPDEAAEKVIQDYVNRSGVKFIARESDSAFYRPGDDTVVVPLLSQYEQTAEYYSTVYHELTHSTGHSSRLNRITDVAAFGSETYSKEELVAELGSAFLTSHVGLETPDTFRNSAGYLQGWLKALRNDKKPIVSAAGKAEKAVQLILGEQDEETENE